MASISDLRNSRKKREEEESKPVHTGRPPEEFGAKMRESQAKASTTKQESAPKYSTPQAASLPSPVQMLRQQHQRFQPAPKPVEPTLLEKAVQAGQREIVQPISRALFGDQQGGRTVTQSPATEFVGRLQPDPVFPDNPVGKFLSGLTSAGPGVERMLGRDEVAEQVESGYGRGGQIAQSILPGAMAERAAAGVLTNAPRILGAIGRGAAGGLGGEAAYSTQQAKTPEEAGKNLAIGVGAGAVGGAALEGLGRGVQALRQTAQKAAQNVVGRDVAAASSIESAAASVPTGRLRVQNNTETLSKLMGEIKPVVTERMTPPLENQRELARWLQPHLGNTSLNEINRLPYDDMVELASEVRRSMNVPDMARQVASERGRDLDSLLDNTAPTFRQTADRMRMAGAAGAIEPPQNVKVAIKPSEPYESPQIESVKQNWFNKLFGDQQVGITAMGNRNSGRIVTTEQQIVNNPIINSVKGTVDKAKQTGRAAYQNSIDYLSPLKTINRETYNTAMDAARANNIANTIVRDKFVNNQGEVIGNSLNDIMRNTRGLGKKVDDYLILRHAETRMKRGERVYDDALQMTPDKARRDIQTLEHRYPELKRVGEEWDAWNTNILDNAVSEGLISQAARDAMRSQNPNYASMRRQFSTAEKFAHPKWGSGGSAFSGQKAPIKEVSPTGSTRKIVSPLKSAIEQAYAWKNAELRNRTMQEIVKSIQADPDGMKGIAELVQKPSTSMRSLDEALRDGGSEEFLDALENDFRSLFKPHSPNDDKVVRAMVNGNPVFVKVHNPEAAKALLGMGSDQAGIVLKTMQFLSDATKRGATGLLSPMFAIKSVTADVVQAAVQSPNAFKHLAVDVPHAAISSIADMLHIPGLRNLAEDFRRSGGEYSALLRGDRRLNKSVNQLRRESPLSTRGIAKGAVSALKSPFKALEAVSDRSENLNRMAAFRRAMVGKERTPENVRNAINAARESTVNYSRRGALSQEAEAFFPYQNAAIQGLYRHINSLFKNPIKTIGGITTLVVAPKLYEYAKFHDDPDYQRLPARERYRNLFISKNADGSFNKIYMAPEYMVYGAFITDVLNDVIKNDPEAYKGTLDAVVNAFTPPMLSGPLQGATQGGGWEQSIAGLANSTVLGPAASVGFNQSFTGAPIVPQRLQGRSPELQFDERTSAVGKKLGEVLKLSPMKVDYILRSYGGDPARLLLPLTSDVGGGNTRNTVLRNFIVDPVFTNTLTDDYYSAKEALQRAKADNAAGRELPEWFNDDIYKLATSTAKGPPAAPAKQISDLNTEKRNVQGDKSLSAEAKTKKLRELQQQINEIYIDVNSRLREAGVPMPSR